MAVEVGTAYISIVAQTSGIPRQLRSALGTASSIADQEGQAAGNRLASGLGKTLKVGGVAAMAAAGTAMGVALTKGLERLTAIDDAEGKLAGLGHSAEGTAKIMQSALAAVKGTAYGLGDAATIAASAVAAGVKPGKDLTKYLTLTADAAAIAGTDLGEMGSIMNGVRTSGSAMTDTLNQLSDRGVPIFQWLQEEVGLTGADFEKFVTDGKVSAEIFEAAIAKNIGGAAQASGKTVRGAFANMQAAMGRLGAAALKPTFERLPATFTSLTKTIDGATPALVEFSEALDTKVFDEWIPKAKDAWATFSESEFAQDAVERISKVLGSAADSATDLAPAAVQAATALGQASAALGVSGWQLFLTALEIGAGLLAAVVPLLQTLGSVMSNNQGLVTALAAAFLLFKTVPSIMGRVTGAVAPMSRGISSANGHLRQAALHIGAVTTATGAMVRGAAGSSMAMGRFGSAIAQVGRSVPAVAQMQSAFVTATNQAARFGRTAGTVSAAMAGVSAAGKGVVNALGGGMNVAMMAGVAAIALFASSSQAAKSSQMAYEKAVANTEKSQTSLNEALVKSRGAMDDQAIDALTQRVSAIGDEFEAVEGKRQSFMNALGDSSTWKQAVTLGFSESNYDKTGEAADKAEQARKAIEGMGMSAEKMALRVSGSSAAFLQFRTELASTGEGGEMAAQKFDAVRKTLLEQQDAARNAVPGMTELQGAMQKFADSTATASDKSNALKTALDALNPDRTAGEAMAHHNEVVREIAKTTQEAWDANLGFGNSLGGVRGVIEGTTENGAALRESILGIVDATVDAASSGANMTEVNAKNAESFKRLAEQAGLEVGEIEAIANRLGLSDIDLVVKSTNAGDVTKELLEVQRAYDHVGAGVKTITLDASQIAASRTQLEQFGFDIQDLPNGQVRLTATDAASPILAMVTAKVLEYDGRIGIADIDINKTTFDLKDQEALGQLQNLRSQVTNPQAGLLIDKLLQGKAVSMAELQVLNGTIANPKADMDIAKVMEKLGLVNAELDRIAQQRTARITAIVEQQGVSQQTAEGAVQAGDAVGNALGFADGGVRPLPKSAQILRSQKTFVTAGEPETGGELYIPLAPSKRERSLALWRKGGELLGVGKHEKFANGGIRANDFDELAKGGFGASQPLTGAPYNWGGVNWGDCSGAMSAFARFAAGLPIWAGRFATGSMASALQAMGAVMGRGGSGDMRLGWKNGGPGGGHTAGTLPSGKNVEMGGGYGGGMYGGSVGADDPQFTDHAHFPASMFGPTWTDPGTDPGGFVTRPDSMMGTAGSGSYGAGSGSAAQQSPEQKIASSFSENLGNAASAFVKGQVTDALGVFGISDSPGWLGAISQYQQDNPPREPSANERSQGAKVTDPGTQVPGPGEDLGGQTPTQQAPALGFTPTGNAIKDAVKAALLDKGWSDGPEWDATDWIFNKEASWNPLATNPSSGAFGLPQFNPSSGTLQQYLPDRNPDPGVQADAFERYIADRYGNSPSKAKEFHLNNGWYDKGGFLPPGQTLVTNNTGKPEPVLNPAQWAAIQDNKTSKQPSGPLVQINNPTYQSESEAVKRQRDYVSRQIMRAGGR